MSQFDDKTVALVCNTNFPYDFDSIQNLTIYNYMACVKAVTKKYQVDNLNRGIYAGTVDSSKLKNKQQMLDWITYET